MTQRIGASRTENQPRILRFSHIRPSWLLGCAIFVGLALIPIHVWAQQPVIRSIVPAQPAPGQVVTIQGHSLFSIDTTIMVTVQIPDAQPPSGIAEVLVSPSNPNEVYVRLPVVFLLSDSEATLNLTVNGMTTTYPFQVAANPAAPIPLKICDTSLVRCPEISSARVNDRIGIKAFGTEINGNEVTAVFSQESNVISEVLEVGPPLTDAIVGIVNEFIVPELVQGRPALVQLKVSGSEPSFALQLMIQQQ